MIELVKQLNAFSDYCAKRGVSIYISFSPLMEGDRPKQVRSLTSLEKDMRAKVRMKFVGDSIGYIYPKEYFFDNEFHLNGTGRGIRTRHLVDTMKGVPELASAPKK